MPGMSGTDVLAELAADAATREIPVVVLTSAELDDSERRTIEAARPPSFPRTRSRRAGRTTDLTQTLARLGLA